MIKLTPSACVAIKGALSGMGLPLSVRIEIRSTGCCDSSLGMIADQAEETDLIEKIDGLTILMQPAIHARVGEVSIFCVDHVENYSFIIVSERPLNEWEGFGRSNIRPRPSRTEEI